MPNRRPLFRRDNSKTEVMQTRIHHIDSVIVRILKARRRIGHQDLLAEVTKHLAVSSTRVP
jgi:hypothetical protein